MNVNAVAWARKGIPIGGKKEAEEDDDVDDEKKYFSIFGRSCCFYFYFCRNIKRVISYTFSFESQRACVCIHCSLLKWVFIKHNVLALPLFYPMWLYSVHTALSLIIAISHITFAGGSVQWIHHRAKKHSIDVLSNTMFTTFANIQTDTREKLLKYFLIWYLKKIYP